MGKVIDFNVSKNAKKLLNVDNRIAYLKSLSDKDLSEEIKAMSMEEVNMINERLFNYND